MSKLCTSCNILRDDFYKNKNSLDGLMHTCKDCSKAKRQEYYYNNREKSIAISLEYKKNNKEAISEYNRSYRASNKEYFKTKRKQWKQENPERYLEHKRKASALRRARKLGADYEPVSYDEVFNRDNWICQICSTPIDKNLSYPDRYSVSLDHIKALSNGGTHTYDNVQASHWICNVQKSNIENEYA